MPDAYKSALRNTIKQVRSRMPHSYTVKASTQICNRIRALDEYRHAKKIALYHAIHGEVDLTPIWKSAPMQGKFCYFPSIRADHSLVFLPATPVTAFKKNRYGILEPDVSPDLALHPDEFNIIFMPLVAFDIRCNRIGMGAGYYDKTLHNINKSTFFGLAYQFQRVDFIEPQYWDIPLDAVITNRAVYWRDVKF